MAKYLSRKRFCKALEKILSERESMTVKVKLVQKEVKKDGDDPKADAV